MDLGIKDKKAFLLDSYLFNITTQIALLQAEPSNPELLNVAFNQTIFHPQGGGQPSDQGILVFKGEAIPVKKLIFNREDDIVWHQIDKKDTFKEGEEITLQIDENFRRKSARLHSAGHLIDKGVRSMGLDWEPGKGYHFEDGPYVEFNIKTWEEGTQDKLKAYLNTELNKQINSSPETDGAIVRVYDYGTAKKEIKNLPDYLPEGGDVRWVKLNSSDEGCPCGGTHVKNIADLKKITITKVQKKGKKVKVSYQLD